MTISAVDQARASMLLRYAEDKWLTRIGGNYGVPRPPGDPSNDEMFRGLIEVLAWQPKTIWFTTMKLAEALFGTQADIIAGGDRAWEIYEVNANEIILELPVHIIAAGNENASYMHGFDGSATTPAGPLVNVFTSPGNIVEAADALGGLNVYIFYSGVWNVHGVSSATYDSGTDVSTVTTDAIDVPAALNSAPMYLDVSDAASFEGDYLAADASELADQPAPSETIEHDRRVYLFGNGVLDIFEFYMDLLVRAAGVVLRVEQI